MKIGYRLKQMREKRNLSQKQIAAELQMTQANYHKIESDKGEPKLSALKKLADFYFRGSCTMRWSVLVGLIVVGVAYAAPGKQKGIGALRDEDMEPVDPAHRALAGELITAFCTDHTDANRGGARRRGRDAVPAV